MVIVKLCEPKREDSFVILARYIQRELEKHDTRGLDEDNFATLSRYMTRDASFPAVATNCGVREQDIDGAVQVIRDTQSLNTRARKKTMHLVVSFPAGEIPTEDQLATVEKRLTRSLGMEHLQRIRVVHTDTDYLHMHIAVSRIDPVTHRSIQPSRDFDRLQREAAQLEIELGLERCNGRDDRYPELSLQVRLRDSKDKINTALEHANTWDDLQSELEALRVQIEPRRSGVVFVDLDTQMTIAGSSIAPDFSRKSLERQLGPIPPIPPEQERSRSEREPVPHEIDTDDHIADEAFKLQRHRGVVAFQTWALERRDELAAIVENSLSWEETQDQLAQYDVALVRYRQGLSLVNLNGPGAVAASKIDRAMSRQSMEERLGPFEPSRHIDGHEPLDRTQLDSPARGYEERPYERLNDSLFSTYLQDLDTFRDRALESRERASAQRNAVFARHAAAFQREARSIRYSFMLDSRGKRRAYRRLSQRRRTRYQQLKAQTRSPPTRVPSYRRWLLDRALKGDSRSLDALSSLSARFNEPAAWNLASNGDVSSIDETRNRRGRPTAVFRDGSTEMSRDGVPLIDDGKRLHCTSDDLESVRALLAAAQERYASPLEIDGGEEFMTSVAICAIEMETLTFADQALQARVNQLRQQRNVNRSLEQEQSLGRLR